MPKATRIEYKSTLYDIEDAAATKNISELQNGGDLFKKMGNLIYPIGSVYISVHDTSPQTIFGGTWARLSEGFLKVVGSGEGVGSTGGDSSIRLTTNQLPSHVHSTGVLFQRVEPSYAGTGNINLLQQFGASEVNTGTAGNGDPITIDPVHWKVAAWYRTALYTG